MLHCDAIHDHSVEGAVADLQHSPFRAVQLAKGVVQCGGGKVGVEPCECVAKVPFQDDLAIVGTLCACCIGGDVRPVDYAPAQTF